MAPKSQKPPRKPSSPNPEENARDEGGSSTPSPPNHEKEQKSSSKKRKSEQDNGNPTLIEKKKVGARVFTHEDEITILQGMIDSKLSIATKGLLAFLEGKLGGDFNYIQLYEKIRRFREKFVKNMRHSDSLKGHDASVFDLSVQIWGKDEILPDLNQRKENLLRNSPMKITGEGENGCSKNKLREDVACFLKECEMKLEFARLKYEQMKKE